MKQKAFFIIFKGLSVANNCLRPKSALSGNDTDCFKTYIANRVTEILEGSSVAKWCHVPSKRNPADIFSRGAASPEESLKNQRDQQKSCYKAPKILWNNTETEENENTVIELPDTNKEIKRKRCFLY